MRRQGDWPDGNPVPQLTIYPNWHSVMALHYVFLAIALFVLELFYFRLARKFNIIDKPNNRSSHSDPTIRGGGIIFFVAVLMWFVYQDFLWPWMMAGLIFVAVVSFLDDLKPQQALLRFVIHMAAVLLIFYQVPLFDWSWWLIALALIVCIGTLNGFNFMDGINGITGVYATVNLCSFWFIDEFLVDFTDSSLLISLLVANAIFLFLNFRKRARCFAGDIGSVTLAFLQIFFLLQLIKTTDSLFWVLMFFVFGIDSTITILYRLKKRENIFTAHRSHLYQFVSNELGWDHRFVALLYGIVQCLMNGILIYYLTAGSALVPTLTAALAFTLYIIGRKYVLSKIEWRSSM